MSKSEGYMYLRLVGTLTDRIKAGAFSKTNMLPPERELCDAYGMSRTTVRKALRELSRQGEIISLRGRGTFLSGKRLTQEIDSIYSFSSDMERIGKVPSHRIIEFGIVPADAKIAGVFGIEVGTEVWRVSLLKFADGVPMISETSYLSRQRFPTLTEEMLAVPGLYNTLEREFSLKADEAEETFEPVQLRDPEAGYFSVHEQTLGMRFERISYEMGRAFEYSVRVMPCNLFRYHVVLKNM